MSLELLNQHSHDLQIFHSVSSSRPQYLPGYKARLPSPYRCQPWPLRVAMIYSSRPHLDLMGSLEFLVTPLSCTSCTITHCCQYDTLLQYPHYTSPGLHASYLSAYVPLLSLSLYLTSTSTNALVASCYHVPLHTINKSFSYYHCQALTSGKFNSMRTED